MTMRKNKFISAVLIFILTLNLMSVLSFAENNGRIEISSANDLIKFSKNCTMDTFSKGKTVVLTEDIDISGVRFSPIPIFSGTFDGQGHTIYGVSMKNAGSVQGLFRYLEKDGIIKNLTVKGDVTPTGTKNTIGGIVGKSYGQIQNCSFDGNVSGSNFVGGIVGINEKTAQIVSCKVSGTIVGEGGVGGIAGKNLGVIMQSSNSSAVNTTLVESKTTINDIDVYADINRLKILTDTDDESDGEEDTSMQYMDMGGIAGFSSGVIQGCKNYGEVGYPHVGYNIGGIVGRQSGFLTDSTNSGSVYGRKDVGGIVGQAEPYIYFNVTDDVLAKMETNLDELRNLVSSSLTDADNATDRMKDSLSAINNYARDAKNSSKSIADQTTDFIDGNVEEINDFSLTVASYIDRLVPLADDMTEALDALTDAIDDAKEAVDSVDITFPDMDDCVNEAVDGLDDLASAASDAKEGVTNLKKALRKFESAVTVKSSKTQKAAISEISTAIESLSNAASSKARALEKIKSALGKASTGEDEDEELSTNITSLKDSLASIIACDKTIVSSLSTAAKALLTIANNTTIDFDDIQDGADYLETMTIDLSSSLSKLGNGITSLSNALTDTHEILSDFLNDADEQFDTAMDLLSSSLDKMGNASNSLLNASKKARNILGDLSDEEPIQFLTLGDDYREAGNSLFESLDLMSGEIEDLLNITADEEHNMTGNMNGVGNKVHDILQIFIDGLKSAREEKSFEDYFKDVSEEDIASIKEGKTSNCKNYGAIDADYNCGGIVGSMAIEYSLDPEDELKKPSSLNFVYETKAIAQACINYGSVTCKKDCAGGVLGKMDVGTAISCENYGDVEIGGDYAGGIAGQSASSVISSYSKSSVKGGSYVGGIAGQASRVRNTYSISSIEADEYYGAIAGYAKDNNADIINNYYVDKGCGAIDNISYSQKAEPISYDSIKRNSAAPSEFISFSVTFVADGVTVAKKMLEYNEPLKYVVQPEVPEKDGYYGTWEDYSEDNITGDHVINAVYKEWLTIIESDEKNDEGKVALAFAEGEFTDKTRLSVTESDENPPKKEGLNTTVGVYNINLKDSGLDDNAVVPIRFLNANRNKAEVWQYIDGKWVSLSDSSNGRYIKFNMQGTNGVICVSYTDSGLNAVAIIIIVVLILIVLAIATFIIIKKKKVFKNDKPMDSIKAS